MTKNRTQEVLYSSEAALRLVDHELSELHDVQDASAIAPAPVGFDGLGDSSALLGQANTQIISVLTRLRQGRAAIESTAVGKVRITQDKLREVTSATEDATQDITSQQLAHASALLDEMEQRLIEVAKIFDPSVAHEISKRTRCAGHSTPTYDANANTRNFDSRQALADEIFTAIRSNAG